MMAKPQAEHEWLRKMVGEWTVEGEGCNPEPGGEPVRTTGTETVRSLGGLWVLAEGTGPMPGTDETAHTVMTLGYDPKAGQYVGTWVGSMMTNLWVYAGKRGDGAEADTLTLETEGPDMSPDAPPGKTALYRDVVRFEDDDNRTLTSQFQGADGAWVPFMTVRYRRKK